MVLIQNITSLCNFFEGKNLWRVNEELKMKNRERASALRALLNFSFFILNFLFP